LAAFILVGGYLVLTNLPELVAKNWTPFIPENTGDGEFGVDGIMRAASIVFFAYIGFEAVSTAGQEAKDPKRDMPFGIIGSLVVCTVIYMLVAAIMTLLVPYASLNVPDPVAVVVDSFGPQWSWLAKTIKVGAIIGLTSVVLVLMYAQTRIFYTMARDGLLPRAFAVIHPKFRTPWIGTILLGVLIAIAAAFLPISILGDLVSLGTATAFSIVCLSVIFLRIKHPDMPRPFKVPGGIFTAVLGILACLFLASQNLIPMFQHAAEDNPLPLMLLGGYAAVGAIIYAAYGFWNSKLAKGIDITEETTMSSPAEAMGSGVDNQKD